MKWCINSIQIISARFQCRTMIFHTQLICYIIRQPPKDEPSKCKEARETVISIFDCCICPFYLSPMFAAPYLRRISMLLFDFSHTAYLLYYPAATKRWSFETQRGQRTGHFNIIALWLMIKIHLRSAMHLVIQCPSGHFQSAAKECGLAQTVPIPLCVVLTW